MSTTTTSTQKARVTDADAAQHYSMVIQWDPNDCIYAATVPELEGCVTHGATYEEAARQGQDAIATWIGTVRAYGDPIPTPQVRAWRDGDR